MENRTNDYDDEAVSKRREVDMDPSLSAGGVNGVMPSPMRDVNEEMGADFAYGMPLAANRQERRAGDADPPAVESGGMALGWVALVFALAALFIWPVLLGITAAVLGFIAYRQGARGLGAWSMIVGVAAAALYLVVVPFYNAIV